MSDLISVIIPAYNAEKYLSKCIESVIAQTYEILEIIVVNDGSTDNTEHIAHSYTKDSRVRVFNKKNGGLSDARNYGISESKGKYLFFLDSDDWIDEDTIEFLYAKLCQHNLGYSSISTYDTNESNGEITVVDRGMDKLYSDFEAINDVLNERNFTFDAAQAKLYKSTIFKEVKFKEGRIFEDTLSFFRIAKSAKSMGYFNVPKYHYLIREGSLTHSGYNKKSKDQVLAYLDNLEFITCNYPNSVRMLEHNIYSAATANFMKLVLLNKEKAYEEDYNFYCECMKNFKPVFTKKRAFIYIFYILNKFSNKLSIFLVKLMRKRISNILEIEL